MAGEQPETMQALIVEDEEGNTYLVPWEQMERFKLSAAEKTQLRQELGSEDVAGYSLSQGVPHQGHQLIDPRASTVLQKAFFAFQATVRTFDTMPIRRSGPYPARREHM